MPNLANVDEKLNRLIEDGNHHAAIRYAFSASGPLAGDEDAKAIVMAKIGREYLYLEPGNTPDLSDASNYVRTIVSTIGVERGMSDV